MELFNETHLRILNIFCTICIFYIPKGDHTMKTSKQVTIKPNIGPVLPDKNPYENMRTEIDQPTPKRGPEDVPVELQHFDDSKCK